MLYLKPERVKYTKLKFCLFCLEVYHYDSKVLGGMLEPKQKESKADEENCKIMSSVLFHQNYEDD
jgi:hypothetical protein